MSPSPHEDKKTMQFLYSAEPSLMELALLKDEPPLDAVRLAKCLGVQDARKGLYTDGNEHQRMDVADRRARYGVNKVP